MKHKRSIACLGNTTNTPWFEQLQLAMKQFMQHNLAPDHNLDIQFLRSSFPTDFPNFPTDLIKIYGLRHIHFNHQIQLAANSNLTILLADDYHPLDQYTRDFFAKIQQLAPNTILWFPPDNTEFQLPSKSQIESKPNVIPATQLDPETLAKLVLYLLTPNIMIYSKHQDNEASDQNVSPLPKNDPVIQSPTDSNDPN